MTLKHWLLLCIVQHLVFAIAGADEANDKLPPEALTALIELAEGNNPAAQMRLGAVYMNGAGGQPVDQLKAVYWITQAAKQEFPEAKYQLAVCFENGIGVDRDADYALQLYVAAAEAGVSGAAVKAGLMLRAAGRNEEAAHHLKASAQAGNLDSIREYGKLLLETQSQDPVVTRIAIRYLEKVAAAGDAEAQLALADCYAGSYPGIPRDAAKMMSHLWEAAAALNHPEAQSKIGYCFENGLGVARDTGMAVKWYRRAADQKYAPAMVNLGHCYTVGKGLPMDRDSAFNCYKVAADMKHPDALYHLAVCYANGLGVEEDAAQAVALYTEAADAGHAHAMRHLAVCYLNGIGVTADRDRARDLLQRAADVNDVESQDMLQKFF